jgi:hypothetical protein
MERFPWIHRFQYIEMWKRLPYTTDTKTKMIFDPTFHVYLCLSNLSGKHWIFINGDLLIRLKWLLLVQRSLRGLGGIHVPLVRQGCRLGRSASAEAVWLYVEVVTPYLCVMAVIYERFALCSLVCGRLVMWYRGWSTSGGTLGWWSQNVVLHIYWAWRSS